MLQEKPIKGYEGLYTVDENGIIFNEKTWCVLKPDHNKYGYDYVQLFKNGKRKKYRVHRLVAEAFLDNPNNFTDVNHKNENKRDNRLCNLEWCDRKYNSSYGTAQARLSTSRKNSPKVYRVPVIRIFPYKFYNSIEETRKDGYCPTHVRECCLGIRKTHKNSEWRFAVNKEVKKFGKVYTFIKER